MKEVISKKEMGVSRHSSIILGLLFLVIQGCAGVGPDLEKAKEQNTEQAYLCLLYTSPSPRDGLLSRMPSSA